MPMSEADKERLTGYLQQMFMSMKASLQIVLKQAETDGIVYPIHGEQIATPEGAVRDVWKVRSMCVDGYARTFDEQRETLNYIARQLANEEMDRRIAEEEGGN